jgi:hypothetical protein
MKITFKVRHNKLFRRNTVAANIAQDLKQNKFVIEAEPSETVRSPPNVEIPRPANIYTRSASSRQRSRQRRAGKFLSRS